MQSHLNSGCVRAWRKKNVMALAAVILSLLVLFVFLGASGGFGASVANASTSIKSDQRASINFTYRGKSYKYVDNIIAPTDYLVAEQILNRKINAPTHEKLRLVEKILQAGGDYTMAINYCFPLLEKTINRVLADVNTAPKNSEIFFNPNAKPMFSVSREEPGYELGREALYRDTYMHLLKGQRVPLIIKPKSITPEILAYHNLNLTHKRVRFTTSFAKSNPSRSHNIALALSSINGTRLNPKEEFSFNKTVGARTAANGYKEAKIIMDGKYVDGVGGGVCQASTTLYNAALRADMRITQVRNHSLISSYVPASFDAMVNSGTSDLRFVNDGDTPVFIKAYTDGANAVVEFYGQKLPYTIDIESAIIARTPAPPDVEELDTDYKFFDSTIAQPGDKKRIAKGYGATKSEGYLLYKDYNGNLLERKHIRKDTYKSLAGKVVVAP